MSFIRTKENFICEHCGLTVQGDGYTNHCPRCFYSKHVDVEPGDRAADCGGLMKPVSVRPWGRSWKVQQRCLTCGKLWENKLSAKDDVSGLLEILQTAELKTRKNKDLT